MRITRMRAMVAGVLGAAMIAAAPAASATPTPTPTTPAPTATATPTGSSDTVRDILGGTPTPTATPTDGTGATPGAETTASADPDATPTVVPDASASADATATAEPSPTTSTGTGDPLLDGFLSLLPFKVPLDKEIDGIEDFDVNPLLISFTCGAGGPEWTLRNVNTDKAFGYGWFDTSLGAGIDEIGPGETQKLTSRAMAVIAAPWDAETGYLLVTLPTVGVSDCEDTAPPAASPIALPFATPAAQSVVHAEPYYTG